MNDNKLKLQAKDAEDIDILASLLQDSLAPVCDMTYRAEDKNFIMIVHRFRWDAEDQPERICCALDVSGVERVQHKGVESCASDQILDLLTLSLKDNVLSVVFAGDSAIRLTLGAWGIKLRDFGDPWPVRQRPKHEG